MNPIHPWLDPAEVRRLAEKLLAPPIPTPPPPAADPGFHPQFVGFVAAPAEPPAATAPPNPVDSVSTETGPEEVADSMPAPPVARAFLPAATNTTTSANSTGLTAPPAVELPPHADPEPLQVASPAADPEPLQVASPAAETVTPATSPARASGPFLERIQRFRDWLGHHFSATGVFLLDRSGAVIFDDSGHGRFHFLARGLALNSRRPGSSAGTIHLKIGAAATLEVIPVETPYGWLVLGAVVPTPLPPATVVIVSDALTEVAAPLRRKLD